MKQIVILISGRGSNMLSLLRAELPCKVVAVISNRKDAAGLEIAKQYGIPCHIVSARDYPDRAAYDIELSKVIDSCQADFIVLAGFMRILSAQFVNHFAEKIINIHPSLLPAYPGLNTHARALADGVKLHGCTVHFVTAELDHGPVIIQAAVPVTCSDTEASLAERVLHEEHRIYPQALRWLCQGQVELHDDGIVRLTDEKQSGFALVSPGLD